jgi:hypothetical protein
MQVYEQPTRETVAKLLSTGSGTLRAVRDTRNGDLYVWDAEEALHEEAIRHLRLTDFAENVGQIHSLQDFDCMTGRGK